MTAAPSNSALANDSNAAVIGSTALFGLRPYHEEAAVTIYHGDCRQIAPLLGRFDLLLTENNRLTNITTGCMLWV